MISEDYEQYYLKYHKAPYNAHELQAEWLCSALLQLWSIPTPEVAVLVVDESLLRNLPREVRRLGRYLQRPAFGSKEVFGAQDSSELLNGDIELETLVNPEDLLWIALFDAWVANDDRRASHHNTLIAPTLEGKRYKLWAIDHAYTFGRIDFRYLDPQYLYFDIKKNLIQAHASRAYLYKWRQQRPLWTEEELRAGCYLRIKKCKEQFLAICEWLPQPYKLSEISQTALSNFLFSNSRIDLILRHFFACLP
ncbi:hypothetical protein BXP70_28465 [Hymenobacter crusticola]|uniref:HipA-like kinase domain-containing protein n=1 Tax=Hymenobacter crusticola TaxID=1770526 RepID=A0A243W540_9BACT|nr:hypothetical protein BXP70_28465 [Hymenobacter crusticola]